MHSSLGRAAALLFPDAEGQHGVLPPLLVALTFVTGLVDAVSYLGLDRVFVANMTGNVVFLGFALAGDVQLSATASLLAAGSFVAGAWLGGRIAPRVERPLRLFALLVGAHAVLVAAALVLDVVADVRDVLIVLLALGMGLQNAVVGKLAVPDLNTTVLTRTLTGLAADRFGPASVRRFVSVAAMFAGALAGGLLQLRHGTVAALAPALLLLALVALTALLPGAAEPRTS
ncbi:membrane protein [Streptomyces longisporoflavus]|uniref:YoaK family protein n=1 Tax=Streptomyces longisporoflavus TaxID=28044 RepID=UPI00167E1A2B|nr:YoaK family protein [Streptomyces longisporoflavus]GGV42082.1 membrane protein [Streptomyces longisporoflavus]